MSTRTRTKNYAPTPDSDRSPYIIGGLAILVIAALIIGGVLWTNSKNKPRNDGYGSVQNPDVAVSVQDNGVVLLSKPTAAQTIDLFADPLCPACAALEHLSGQALASAVDNGDVAVRYHMLNFLDRSSGSRDYSTRAGAALLSVANSGDALAYSAFHARLFTPDTQPHEGGRTDHSNDDLAVIAREAGASEEVAKRISSGSDVEAAAANAAAASQALKATGAVGTPTVVANDKVVDTRNGDWVSALSS